MLRWIKKLFTPPEDEIERENKVELLYNKTICGKTLYKEGDKKSELTDAILCILPLLLRYRFYDHTVHIVFGVVMEINWA